MTLIASSPSRDHVAVAAASPPPHRVTVVIPSNFALFPVAVALESFANPRIDMMRDRYDVRLCGPRPGFAAALGGRFGAAITDGVETVTSADTVIVPQAGTPDQPADPTVVEALHAAYQNGSRMVSFGSGAFLLARAGVLDGHRVATHWKHARRLAEAFPRVRVEPNVLYVDDGQVLTSAGRVASIDLVLHIIRKDHGAQLASLLAREVVAYPHRDGAQAQVISTPVPTATDDLDGIRKALRYALEHLDEDLGLPRMAAMAHMSTRHFSRRFREVTGTTPVQWLNHQRLARACELLEETNLPIERVAMLTGFRSPVTFRQRFTREFLTAPSAYRRTFQSSRPAELPSLAARRPSIRRAC